MNQTPGWAIRPTAWLRSVLLGSVCCLATSAPALAAGTLEKVRDAKVEPGVFKRNAFVAVIAMLYSVYALWASGKDAVMGGMLVMGIGYIVFGFIAPRFVAAPVAGAKA